jgi:hypothetical protein
MAGVPVITKLPLNLKKSPNHILGDVFLCWLSGPDVILGLGHRSVRWRFIGNSEFTRDAV